MTATACAGNLLALAKEFFRYSENRQHLELLDQAARQSGLSRGEVFSDFLHMAVCSLSGGQLEDQYMDVVKRHTTGKMGHRSCDSIAQLFGSVVCSMEETRDGIRDVLGDLFEGGITYGENSQFLTPESISKLLGKLTNDDVESPELRTVSDPCCGSGRMLLAVAEEKRNWEFVGQDIDLRCVRMTAINLALRNLYGYAIHGNSLTQTVERIYRTGFNGRGFLRELKVSDCPVSVQQTAESQSASPGPAPAYDQQSPRPTNQLRLF